MIFLNEEKLEFEVFPNGETRVVETQILGHLQPENKVAFKYENDSDLIKLMFVKKYLDEQQAVTALSIQYMPYSRMDRREGNTAFTLKYVAEFINALQFASVEIIEPHSDVTPALIDRGYATYPTLKLLEEVVRQVGFDREQDYLFFPDAGAQKRYSKLTGYKQLVGHKNRDFTTGQITKLSVVGEMEQKGCKVIILDDLCSYGGTFKLSAQALKEIGAAQIYLLVAHCEDSVHKGDLLKSDQYIETIFTTSSILTHTESPKIKVLPL